VVVVVCAFRYSFCHETVEGWAAAGTGVGSVELLEAQRDPARPGILLSCGRRVVVVECRV
jgi:hypothetical protein